MGLKSVLNCGFVGIMSESNTSSPPKNTPTTWLSIGKASKLLGVNESTLRHWANKKTIRTFRTAGGHRRFAEEDLHLLMSQSGGPGETRNLSDLKDIALTRIRRRLNRGRTVPGQWHRLMPEEQRLKLRFLGRRLLDLVSDYLTRPRRRSELLEEAKAIGEDYGAQAADYGMSLDDALEAFLFFRNSLDSISTDITQGQDLNPRQALEIWRQLNTFMDQVLLATIRAYQTVSTRGVAAARH